MYNAAGHKIFGWFMENEIWFRGILQPPRRMNIISFDGSDVTKLNDEDLVQVLGEDGNWYTIQKKEIHLIDEEEQDDTGR